MRTSIAISLLCAISALAASTDLKKRQARHQETCAESYGPGYVKCGTRYCYNPGRGEPCCADGNGSCDAGQYCAEGPENQPLCCNVGASLGQCGAIKSIGTLAAPTSSGTPYPPGGTSTALAPTGTGGSLSSTSYSVPVATGGAKRRLGVDAAGIAVAGLGVWIPFL